MRRITKAKISFLSLCPRGKNRLPTIFKDDGSIEVGMLAKGLNEEGVLYAIVYAPEFRDKDGDIASAAVIKDMAYTAAKEGMDLDLRHDCKALSKDQAFVAEQFIVQKGDPRFSDMKDYEGNEVDPTGSWGVAIKIDDPELRRLYREGEWAGVSMFGQAKVVNTNKEDLADRIVERLSKKLNTQEDPMPISKEDLEAIGKVAAEAAVAAVKATQTETTPKAAEDKTKVAEIEAPVFKGDPSNVEDVKAYRETVRKHSLQKKLAKASSPEEIDKILAELEKSDDEGGSTEESDELKKAKAEAAEANAKLAKLQGRSAQAANEGTGSSTPEPILTGLGKEDQDIAQIGLSMAQWANKQRKR